MQLIGQMDQIFKKKKLGTWLFPYEILATGPGCGVLEFIEDAMSIDAIKKKNPGLSLDQFFIGIFPGKNELKRARKNFAKSLAAYSLAMYILQVKDRHNGNILIDKDGHIVHLDFGFIFTSSPAGNMNFEKSPFKLTQEFVDVLNGMESSYFKLF